MLGSMRNAVRRPMYLIGLTLTAYIGWRKLSEMTQQWNQALLNLDDQQHTDYLNPDNWHIDTEEF